MSLMGRDRFPAYLVLWVNTTTSPPQIVGAGIYGEEMPTSKSFAEWYPIAIRSIVSFVSFERSRDALLEIQRAQMPWLTPMIIV